LYLSFNLVDYFLGGFMNNRTRTLVTLAVFCLTAAAAFAQADILPAGMTTLANSILAVFTGAFVKTILIIMLAGCAVAYGFNKDNEKMKRNIITIAVAIGILVAASTIVEAVWEATAS
jgi:type IV secretory pathway VirB2 component (pilin)